MKKLGPPGVIKKINRSLYLATVISFREDQSISASGTKMVMNLYRSRAKEKQQQKSS